MNNIPLHICEEHHEAFIIWHDAIQKGIIDSQDNTLIHVDRHSDMNLPVLHTDINTLQSGLSNIIAFTYDELGIDSFIVPAIYQKLFNTVYWIKTNAGNKAVEQRYVRTLNASGKVFISAKDSMPWSQINNPEDRVYFQLYTTPYINIEHFFVLDIDLDFFSCDLRLNHRRELEITKQEYDKFKTERYHFLRLNQNCFTEERDNRYFMIFNRNSDEQITSSAKKDIKDIDHRVTEFSRWLQKLSKPSLITVCRSRYSHFSPADQWAYMEKKLLEKLQSLYTLDVRSIHEIVESY